MLLSAVATTEYWQLQTKSLVSPKNRTKVKRQQKHQNVGSKLLPTYLVNNKPTANI